MRKVRYARPRSRREGRPMPGTRVALGGRAGFCISLLAAASLVGCGDDGDGAAVDAGVDAEVVGSLANQGSTMMEDVRIEEGGLANFIVDTIHEEGERIFAEDIQIAFV